MDTISESPVYIQDVSPLCAVELSPLGDNSTVGFTITYSDGKIENVMGSGSDPASTLSYLQKKREAYLLLLNHNNPDLGALPLLSETV